MKRRSRSSPPTTKHVLAEPGTPGPFTSDLAREQLNKDFPGASPATTRKSVVLKKQLFHSSMVLTRNMAETLSTLDQDTLSDSSGPQAPIHQTPPDQLLGNLVIDEAPREPRQPRERDPPDLLDVVTQQTEILAGMLAELRARQALPTAPAVNQAEPPADPNFNWSRLVLPPETNFQVPGEGQVQRMAPSLFTRVPTMAGRDQHEARFVLQVISLWPELHDEERVGAFQRLNVYCIVAALGWPAATVACASNMASTDFVLPPGVVLPRAQGPQKRNNSRQLLLNNNNSRFQPNSDNISS